MSERAAAAGPLLRRLRGRQGPRLQGRNRPRPVPFCPDFTRPAAARSAVRQVGAGCYTVRVFEVCVCPGSEADGDVQVTVFVSLKLILL